MRMWVIILGFVIILRSILFGVTFAIGYDSQASTVLFDDIIKLPFSTALFGWVLLAACLVAGAGYILNKKLWIAASFSYVAIIWIFAGIVYWIEGSWVLAITNGFTWAILAIIAGALYKSITYVGASGRMGMRTRISLYKKRGRKQARLDNDGLI